jgi:hypothetical protein
MAHFGLSLPAPRKAKETVSTCGNKADIREKYYFLKSVQI